MKRSSGVLLHVSSLPGKYGIGKFGKEAVNFAGFLKRCGFSHWQILPMNPVGEGDSPYMSLSAFAGYIGYIDPEMLVEDGLIYPYELKIFDYHGGEYLTDHDFAYERAIDMLKFAYMRIDAKLRKEMSEFSDKNRFWLDDYALFMALRGENGHIPFWMWNNKKIVKRDGDEIRSFEFKELEEIDFWKFAQYIFYSQWKRTKEAINELGINIMGDMPIYVSMDSCDVWSHPELFKLNDDLSPKSIAGVPPDYFSADGQLWGNPVYDWDLMKKEGYGWWVERIKNAMTIFDSVRIDHFRGFESYWEIPAKAKKATEGHWEKGPGIDFFNKIKEELGDVNIIAEDLGAYSPEVKDLLSDSGFPGMRVMQFGFDPDHDSDNLPHNHSENCVAYTGTHDNNTMLGWIWEADDETRSFALDYCGHEGDWSRGGPYSNSVRAVIRSLWQSPARLVMIPIQDICGYGADARMNTPGIGSGNWRFRITQRALSEVPVEQWERMNKVFKRYGNDR